MDTDLIHVDVCNLGISSNIYMINFVYASITEKQDNDVTSKVNVMIM